MGLLKKKNHCFCSVVQRLKDRVMRAEVSQPGLEPLGSLPCFPFDQPKNFMVSKCNWHFYEWAAPAVISLNSQKRISSTKRHSFLPNLAKGNHGLCKKGGHTFHRGGDIYVSLIPSTLSYIPSNIQLQIRPPARQHRCRLSVPSSSWVRLPWNCLKWDLIPRGRC